MTLSPARPLLTLMVLAVALAAPISQVYAAPRCFDQTGHCIDGRIRDYWEANGALDVFGYPITAQAPEQNRDTGQVYQTQWMERNRFELHPENAAPYDVLLGRLGDDRLRQLGIDWQTLPKADPSTPHYFPLTGHAIAAEFWDYWRTRGLELGDPGNSERESLALFGQPITEPAVETNPDGDTVRTQWFERARFEYHPNNPDPFKVLLGRLGAEVRPPNQPSPSPAPGPAPSPSPGPAPSPAPGPPPPSFNNCAEDPNADLAPNDPVRIERVDKDGNPETVTLRNRTGTPIDLAGWRICSIRGNQLHATLNETIGANAELIVPSQAQGNIWSNSEPDDAALYDANGSLISYVRNP